jgi:hypothetical protein
VVLVTIIVNGGVIADFKSVSFPALDAIRGTIASAKGIAIIATVFVEANDAN